uniref:Secreted protein n=1 Tax=Macrostomum lignano TaxID=282301 RepID=A0A1I8IGS8_9PLAT
SGHRAGRQCLRRRPSVRQAVAPAGEDQPAQGAAAGCPGAGMGGQPLPHETGRQGRPARRTLAPALGAAGGIHGGSRSFAPLCWRIRPGAGQNAPLLPGQNATVGRSAQAALNCASGCCCFATLTWDRSLLI